MKGSKCMSKAKVLLVAPKGAPENGEVTLALSNLGYEVSSTSTPEETVMTAFEEEAQVVIWPEGLNDESAWSRVRSILESRSPFISVSSSLSVANNAGDTSGNGDELTAPLTTVDALVAQLEHIGATKGGKHQFYTKVGNKLRRIELSEIRYIQVEGKYSAIQLETRQYHVKASLKDLLMILASEDFVRVSRNFVVNLNHIDHIDVYQSTVHVAGEDVPVSRTYKDNLMKNVRLL